MTRTSKTNDIARLLGPLSAFGEGAPTTAEKIGLLRSLRGRNEETDAFIDLGDQFIALFRGDSDARDVGRHFGLVVDDPAKVRRKLEEMGAEIMPGSGVDFHDPWGNYWQMVTFSNIQFMKVPAVMRAMDIEDLEKTEDARREIAERGFAES
jgi:hypothetical protein